MSEVIEITVQYVNPPKEGKKWGSIKSSEGDYYGAPPAMLRSFKAGEVCKIEYDDDGQWKTLKKKIGTTAAPPLSPPPRPRTPDIDAERMWCCAVFTAYIKAGKIPLEETAQMTAIGIIQKSYRQTLGGLQKQRSDDFNDEIGF